MINDRPGPWCDKIVGGSLGPCVGYEIKRSGKYYVAVDGKLGPGFDEIGSELLESSWDGKHSAYTARNGATWLLVTDGVPGSALYDGMSAPSFSPDSKHMAYSVLQDGVWSAIVDGQVTPAVGNLWAGFFVFSNDGSRVSYFGSLADGKLQVILDGVPEPPHDYVRPCQFSPDSKHAAYTAQDGDKWHVIYDGKPGTEYDEWRGDPIFSLDSAHFAYQAYRDGKSMMIIDEHAGSDYDEIGGRDDFGMGGPWITIFSPDSLRTAYAARNGEKWFAVIDGVEGPHYDNVTWVTFSPDSRHVAYEAFTSENWESFVVIDGVREPSRYFIADPGPVWSPDSTCVAYAAFADWGWCVFVNGQAGPLYDEIPVGPIFHPDGSVEYLASKRGQLYRVIQTPDQQKRQSIKRLPVTTLRNPKKLHSTY